MYENYLPQSEKLKKHIRHISILKHFNGTVNYLAFPQLGTTLALYPSANLTLRDKKITISNSTQLSSQVLLLGKYNTPLHINYQNFTSEISINFSPTVLNYFFDENTATLTQHSCQLITHVAWLNLVRKLIPISDNRKKVDIIESFLLHSIKAKNLSIIDDSIAIFDTIPELKISELAHQLQVSTKTINRCFVNYVGCNPTAYKKTLRFRKSIKSKLNNPKQNLTTLCFDSDFYDSPHFTREILNLTKMNPRLFFSDLKAVGDQEFPYKFL